MIDVLRSADFWGVAIPAFAAVFVWWLTERAKLKALQFSRREEHYREMIKAARGFYAETENSLLKTIFLDEVNLLWLYAPDPVIRQAYKFLDAVEGERTSEQSAEAELGGLVAAIREDTLSRRATWQSSLSANDFRHFGPSPGS